MADNGQRDDDYDNPLDSGFRGLMRGLRDLVTQIADPTAPARPQPVSSPGRRPPPPPPPARTGSAAGAPPRRARTRAPSLPTALGHASQPSMSSTRASSSA